MDSNGQRMMTYLQNQIQNIEYQPTYTTEELKETAHNLQDLTKKDTVLIMIGTNDARRHIPHQQAAENIRESINTIRTNNPEVSITIIQPPPITTTDLTATYAMVRYTDNLESIALEQQVLNFHKNRGNNSNGQRSNGQRWIPPEWRRKHNTCEHHNRKPTGTRNGHVRKQHYPRHIPRHN